MTLREMGHLTLCLLDNSQLAAPTFQLSVTSQVFILHFPWGTGAFILLDVEEQKCSDWRDQPKLTSVFTLERDPCEHTGFSHPTITENVFCFKKTLIFTDFSANEGPEGSLWGCHCTERYGLKKRGGLERLTQACQVFTSLLQKNNAFN